MNQVDVMKQALEALLWCSSHDPGSLEDDAIKSLHQALKLAEKLPCIVCGGARGEPTDTCAIARGGIKQAKETKPAVPDNNAVICPHCWTQFCAIPVSVQRLMLDAGFDPPFTHPPKLQVQPMDEGVIKAMFYPEGRTFWPGSKTWIIALVRVVEAYHKVGGIKNETK